MNISANSPPAGNPTTSMRFHTLSCGCHRCASKPTYFSRRTKYQASNTMPIAIDTELARPAPATPRGTPVPQPAIGRGAGDRRVADPGDEIQVDQEVQGLKDHARRHRRRHGEDVANDRALGQVLHRRERLQENGRQEYALRRGNAMANAVVVRRPDDFV